MFLLITAANPHLVITITFISKLFYQGNINIQYASPCHVLPADISKVMQAKKKRLEYLTKNYMKGSQHKLEQLWNNYHSKRFGFVLSQKDILCSKCTFMLPF